MKFEIDTINKTIELIETTENIEIVFKTLKDLLGKDFDKFSLKSGFNKISNPIIYPSNPYTLPNTIPSTPWWENQPPYITYCKFNDGTTYSTSSGNYPLSSDTKPETNTILNG